MGKAICEADKKGRVFWLVKKTKKNVFISQNLIYTPQIGVLSHNWGYLPKLGLYPRMSYLPKFGLSPNIRGIYPKVQFIPQKLWQFPKKIMLSPKFEVISVISQKSLCAPKIWGISQNFGLSPIQFIPKKLGLSPKIRVISQNLGYIPKFSLYPKNLGYLRKFRLSPKLGDCIPKFNSYPQKIKLSPKMGYLPILGVYPKIGGMLGCGHGRSKEGHEFSPAGCGTLLKAWPGIEGQPRTVWITPWVKINELGLGENLEQNHGFYH